MRYNFDEIIDRKGTGAYKTDLCKNIFGTDNLLPLWVADMDFRTPDFVIEAIRERCAHEILGYTIRTPEFTQPIVDWIKYKHNWQIDSTSLGFVPGVVLGLMLSVLAFSNEGDKVIIQPPVYPPFFTVITNNKRQVVENQLVLKDGRYEMDYIALQQQAADPKVKILLLCSPHNPGGRVWTTDELTKLSEICAANNVLVISDEIHADLVLPGYNHIPYATVNEQAKEQSITLMAPSKTFNIAGLGSSSYIIPNKNLYTQYSRKIQQLEVSSGSIFAYTATTAAYTHGAEWLKQLIEYIQGNIDFVQNYLQKHIPQVKAMTPEASFLIWLDFSALGMSDDAVKELLVKKAKLGLNPGTTFGSGGSGFHRLNVGCSRLVLEEAMKRLEKAINQL